MIRRELLRRHGPVVAALVVAFAHFASFDIRSLPIVTDIRFYLYFAWRVTEGGVPHLDFFDNKTQLATFAGAAFHELGDLFGLDPLMAIRVGYLGIAALGGVLLFTIHRRLAGNDATAGLLGLLAYCSFGLLGLMPAIGNLPKLLMVVCASGMALMVEGRRWLLAGLLGSLAFMDWQIGAFAWLAAFVSAILFDDRKIRACSLVIAGGGLGVLPFALGYAVRGGLGETLAQVVGSSLFRGSSSMAEVGFTERVARINLLVERVCPDQEWLFFAGGVGLFVAIWCLWRPARPEQRRLLFPLVFYHLGIVAFSLIDFQWYGDFFALLHSVVFLLGLAWVALYRLVLRIVDAYETAPFSKAIIAAIALILATVVARPSLLRPDLEIQVPTAVAGTTLADQRTVARSLDSHIGGRRVVFLEHSELLFLMRSSQPVPFIYWNEAAWHRYREPEEDMWSTRRRLVLAAAPELLVSSRRLRNNRGLKARSRTPIESDNGRYRVFVMVPP